MKLSNVSLCASLRNRTMTPKRCQMPTTAFGELSSCLQCERISAALRHFRGALENPDQSHRKKKKGFKNSRTEAL